MHDEERGLLDAIAAHPDADHDRRVYADWLEDHGESARAEFVRIQVALARLGEDHPDRTALMTRERGLLLEHEENWTLGLRHLVKEWTWRRGFVDEVAVFDPPRPLTAARFDELLAWPFVRKITARQGWRLFPGLVESEGARRLEALRVVSSPIEPGHFRPLLHCPRLERLESLELMGCGLTDSAARRLASSALLRRLHTLDLSGNNLTDTGAIALARSPNVGRLKRLRLSACGTGGDSALALASAPLLSGLTSLDLSGNNLGNHVAALFNCPHLRELSELDLSATEADPEFWSGLLTDVRPLRILRLCDNRLRGSQVFELISSARLPSLRRLDLRAAEIQNGGSSWTGPLETPTTPLELNLSGVFTDWEFFEELFLRTPALRRVWRLAPPVILPGPHGLRLLLSSPHLDNLRHLDASNSYVTRENLDGLLRSDLAKRLTGLDLSSCELGNNEISDLANNHPHLANLSWLSLRNNHVGPRACALAESPHLRNLRHLDLSENHLDDEAAFALAGADHLASPVVLNVSGNPIGPTGSDALFGAARRAFSRGVTIPHQDA